MPLLILLVFNGISEVMEPGCKCNKAHTWSEHQICQEAELASLDLEMNELYRSMKIKVSRQSNEHQIAQRTWIR